MGNRVYVDDKGEHLDYTLKANGLNQYDYISKTKHNIDIEGTVTGEDPTVTVGSVNAIVSGGKFLAEDVTLNNGTNLILVEAQDGVGTTSDSVSVELDISNDKRFSYDANGSLTQVNFRDTSTTYTYDYENRLTKVSSLRGSPSTSLGVNSATEAIYTYDYLGRRIQKVTTSPGHQ